MKRSVWFVLVLAIGLLMFAGCGEDYVNDLDEDGDATPSDGDDPEDGDADADTETDADVDGDSEADGETDGELTDGDNDAEVDGDADGDVEPLTLLGSEAETLVPYVNTFIGTAGTGFGFGSGIPGPRAPFGMIYPSPDTMGESGAPAFYHFGGYCNDDDYIVGFSHTHMYGVGANDYGNILFMPSTNPPEFAATSRNQYRSMFSKENEEAAPGYYRVVLDKNGIEVKLTATQRAAHHVYTFTADTATGYVVIDLGHAIPGSEVSDASILVKPNQNAVEGWVLSTGGFSGRYGGLKIYFVAQFDTAFASQQTFDASAMSDDAQKQGAEVGAYLGFDLSGGNHVVQAQVAISHVSIGNAWGNLNAEMPAYDFEATRQATAAAWEAAMNRVRFSPGSDEQNVIMATALYHAAIMPSLFTDVNGEYLGFDKAVHTADGWTYYTDFSMWDTYRTEHPYLHMVLPEIAGDMMTSLIKMADEGGKLPQWPHGGGYTGCMVGDPADIVLTDAFLKGVEFDVDAAYEHMKTMVSREGTGQSYLQYGYIPGRVAETLEYAIADYSMYLMAKKLGKPAEETMGHWVRSKYYANMWNDDAGYFIGKDENGDWAEGWDDLSWESFYTEGNAWQYVWLVPHDVDGLISLFGGTGPMLEKLTDFLALSKEYMENRNEIEKLDAPLYYWHGNEPDIHAVYLFNNLNRPDLTQFWLNWVTDFHYSDQPDGIAGNDDCGTLSTWYIFSALGFYPVAGTENYWIGRPLFEQMEVDLKGGTLKIRAENFGPENIYVQSVSLNGEAIRNPQLTHGQIENGGELVFVMGPEPGTWGTQGQ